jgi:hypothetical protein
MGLNLLLILPTALPSASAVAVVGLSNTAKTADFFFFLNVYYRSGTCANTQFYYRM